MLSLRRGLTEESKPHIAAYRQLWQATNGASSAFALSDLMAQGSTGDSYTLTHDGDAVSFTLSSGADLGNILK